ncbi:hypothetical protein SAMN05421803_1525 [Nocardiopsis flavescens]|uniref:Uncharacterized protein n=1 Tax=Nocardiopsis flavescens TaxID=758803 RepID=A0A1M6WW06_9ACTN|nr:hypothetical protein [Nocardiopsis flavescens]SHK97749.1 hypothetical protein SAMN05421803_1525 [Nocardiopsis flavescens]
MATAKKKTAPKTVRYPRIMCSQHTLDTVNLRIGPQLTAEAGRKVKQTELVDALIAVGIAHLPEVAALLLTPDSETESDE